MYKIEIEHIKDMEFKARTGGQEFTIDAKGDGLTPPGALLAGLGSCIGVYVRKYAEGSKLGLDNFSITVEAEFSKEPPHSFKIIDILLNLKGINIEERRKRALIEFIKNCPVHNTIKGNPEIEIKLV